MELRDANTTLGMLKSEVIAMCIRKGWGNNGIQHPQHVAAAMMVEMMELLEHFTGIDKEDEKTHFTPSEVTETSEEAADVMMYALQIMQTIEYDVSNGLCGDFSDFTTPISEMRDYAGFCHRSASEQAMRLAISARFLLEELQWMSEEEVQHMIKGGLPDKRRDIGRAFVPAFREMLLLANRLQFDIAGVIMRKIGIVDKRVYSDSEPAR